MSEVDALEIRIRDNSEQAAKGIDRLAESVGKIAGINKDAFKGVFTALCNIQRQAASSAAVVNYLNKVLKELKGIKSVKLFVGSFGQTLADLRNLTPLLESAAQTGNQLDISLQHISQYNLSTLVDQLNKLTPLANTASGLGETLKPVGDLLGSLGRDTSEGNLQLLGGQIGAIRQQLEPISGLIGDISAALSDMSEEKGGAKAFNNMSNALDKFGKFMTGFDYNSEMETYSDVMAFIEDMSNTYAILEKETGNFAGFQGLQQQFGGFVESLTGLQTFLKKFNGDKLEENFGKVMSTMERVNTQMVTLGEQNGGWAGFGQLETICQNVAHSISLVADELERINNAGGCEILDRVMSSVALSSAETAQQTEEIKQNVRESGFNVKELEKGFAKAFNHATKFADMMWRMLKRNIIRKIFEGFSTGVSNLYAWSAALNDNGAFKSVMDNYSTALNTLVNAVGSAAGALLNALYPAFVTVANIIVTAVNALNQFISALTGSTTWNRPNDIATAFDDTAKNAKNASKSTKELLADWDELNVITSKSGSGGSSGGTNVNVDTNSMFTITGIDEKIKAISEEFMKWKDYIIAAGAALLAWKFASGFTDNIKYLIGFSSLAASISLGITGIDAAVEEGAITQESFRTIVGSAIFGAISTGAFTGSLPLSIAIGLTVFAIEITAATLLSARKAVREQFAATGHKPGASLVKEVLSVAQTEVDNITKANKLVIDVYANVTTENIKVHAAIQQIEELHRGVFGDPSNTTAEQLETLRKAWSDFDDAIRGKHNANSDTIFAGIDSAISNLKGEMREASIEAIHMWEAARGEITAQQAKLMTQRDTYLSEFEMGDYSNQDKYFAVIQALTGGGAFNTAKSNLITAGSNVSAINFGEGSEAFDNAMKFISDLQTMFAEASQLNDTATSDSLASLDEEIALLRYWTESGIGDYTETIGQLLQIRGMFVDSNSAEAAELSKILSENYQQLIIQALSGFDATDNKLNYGLNVLLPIIDAILSDPTLSESDRTRLSNISELVVAAQLNGLDVDYADLINNGNIDDLDGMFESLGFVKQNGAWILPLSSMVKIEFEESTTTFSDVFPALSSALDSIGNAFQGAMRSVSNKFTIPVALAPDLGDDPTTTQYLNPFYIPPSAVQSGPNSVAESSHFGFENDQQSSDNTAAAVEKGVSSMSKDVVNEIRELMNELRNKNFVIQVTPSSALGRTINQSTHFYHTTTGE